MVRPGPRNLVTDVDGIAVGNAADAAARTGVTVVVPDERAVAGVDVRGGAPGSRETDLLRPDCHVQAVDAICLSGGSVYGLAAADAVVGWLAAQGRGFAQGPWRMPIVPGAIIFDLAAGGEVDPAAAPPWRDLAAAACAALSQDVALGNAGAGMGARAGRLKGGLGSASAVDDDGLQVGALMIANPVGSAVMPGSGTLWAWALEQQNEMGRQRPPAGNAGLDLDLPLESRLAANTTIGVVATNLALDKAQAARIAMMAHDGIARAIRPVHTPFDGDTVFVLSTGRLPLPTAGDMALARLGGIAADCVARAIGRAVFEAQDLDGIPAYRSRYPDAFGA